MRNVTDCIVPDGGYPTQDGYLRVLNKPRARGGKLVMLHRLEYEKVFGKIPEGYEVNHVCKNRACVNVNHFELLEKSAHRSKDNAQRYKSREDVIVADYLKNPTQTQMHLAKKYQLTQGAVSLILKRRVSNG